MFANKNKEAGNGTRSYPRTWRVQRNSKKNVRLMHGKPLIYYSIQNALACSYIDDVVVSSDDEEILSIAAMYGAKAMNRNSALAQDAVTLDPVIYDAVLRMEQETGKTYDVVVTLQATSPLLTVETLDGALKSFLESDFDTYISAVNKPHLSWTTKDGRCVPNYEKRLNRQQLPPNFLEAGAFLITRRACMSENNRIGANASVYEMPEKEAIDIDSYADWIVCEQELSKKRILFRADYGRCPAGRWSNEAVYGYNISGSVSACDLSRAFLKGMGQHRNLACMAGRVDDRNDIIRNLVPEYRQKIKERK